MTDEFLQSLGRGLDLENYQRRRYFGEDIRILAGEFDELTVELEVSGGDWAPYVRFSAVFDRPLGWGVSAFTDERSGIVSYVQRVREIEIREEQFDFRFLLYGPDPEAVETLLPPATRHQMILLDDLVDELRLTDNSLFLFTKSAVDKDRLRSILKKGIELADRIGDTARELGPRKSETTVARYDQSSIEDVVRGQRSNKTTRADRSD